MGRNPNTPLLHHSITPSTQSPSPMRHPSLVLLSQDHHHGLALALRCRKQALGQLKPMGAAGLRERAKEFGDFYRINLIAHFRAEEEILLPFMRRLVPGCAALLDEDRKSTRLNSSHLKLSRMPSSA